jgi:hypothetical protein
LCSHGQPALSATFQATVDTLLSKSYFGTRYEPATGTLDAPINAGDLDLLGDPSLASALTSWLAVVDRLRYRQVAVTDLTLQGLDPYLRTRVRTGDLIWTDFEHPYSPPWDVEHTDAYLLLSELELQGILSSLCFLSVQTIDLSRQVQVHLDRVRSALESELVGSEPD